MSFAMLPVTRACLVAQESGRENRSIDLHGVESYGLS